MILARADVLRHHIELRGRHIETVRPRIADFNVILHRSVHGHLHDAGEAADAVHVVHDEIADREIGIGLDGLAVGASFRLCAPHAADARHLRVREDGKLAVGIFQSRREAPDRDEALARRGERLGVFLHIGGDVVIFQKLAEHRRAAAVPREHHDAKAEREIMRDIVHRGLDAAAVAGQLLDRDAADRARIDRIAPELEGVGKKEREVRELMNEVLPRDVKLLGAHGHAAGGHELVDVLGELL